MFQPVSSNVQFPELERAVLALWKERRIYEKSLEQRQGNPKFVFYEGPPTANGLPHPGHCLTRAIKDLFPRYRTMRGYLCERKGGWDTHGLPVEVEVCKELGIHSKEEIEQFGVEPFIQRCQQSVWRYMKQWERLTERLGFWIHLDEAYVTYHQSYVESVWWSLKRLFERGLLYQGHKIVWWWAQGGTALSSGEVGQGYREVADPSVYVRFPLVDQPGTSLLVWTTTPWTLPSNQFAAVHPDLTYAVVWDEESGQRLILAADLVPAIAEKVKRELVVESTLAGRDLLGRRYLPPFDYYHAADGDRQGRLRDGGSEVIAWRVVAADFVTTDSGSGVVHQAPAFGEVDFDVLLAEQARFVEGQGPPLICAVGPDGKFTDEAGPYRGRWVKEADKDIVRDLRSRGLLYHFEQYLHEYPFCWRAEDDPLIQYPRRSWFIRTTRFKDRMLANNRQVRWLPEHIRDGRFGNFLESNVDWALSRERYWGTPLPIWVCDQTGRMEAIDSYQALLDKPGGTGFDVWLEAKAGNPELPEDLKVHKPYIDAISYDSPFAPGGRMRRVPDVIDCWYDSGAMPFAQWGFPHAGRETFERQFPADFISEALDQTRGWFYSLLAISTLLFGERDEASEREAALAGGAGPAGGEAPAGAVEESAHPFPHPYRTCIVLGLMLAEWWESRDGKQRYLNEDEARQALGDQLVKKIGKMSKSLRNYRSPEEIFDVYGADALRWYFFANQPPWNSIIYSERAIKDSIPEFLLRLWNVYSFFVIYARIDGFDPTGGLDGDACQLDAEDLRRANGYRPVSERAELDRWVLSELQATVAESIVRMDAYDNYGACARLSQFVDGLSNWYVRRSRERFWSSDVRAADKQDAYWTLYECLVTLSKLIAPFTPFLAETIWQNLAGVFAGRVYESVHLCDYPLPQTAVINQELSVRMGLLRDIASLGRSARMEAKLKVRQPLAKVEVILADSQHRDWLEQHDGLLRDELNVKQIEYTKDAEKYISYQVQPNFKRLGPRVGRLMPAVKAALAQADGGRLLAELNASGQVVLRVEEQSVTLDTEDIQVRLEARPGWVAAQGSHCVVVLNTELSDELVREGHANDLVRLIQERRKELDCQFTDRIAVGLVTGSEALRQALDEHRETIQRETLARHLEFTALDSVPGAMLSIGGHAIELFVQVVP
ncbi:MAG: isoleucine--tRNA ligase [Pirellulaceae bacterium]|nr:isoleucine--tRNA ligase [Pirellulaceae bacterium]